MEIRAKDAKAIREKVAAEKPFIIHKLREYPHRWNSWNPNIMATVQQEIIVEQWDECSVWPRADGMVQVTTLNRRMEQELERLHWKETRKCSLVRKVLGIGAIKGFGIGAIYEVDAELWKAWLAEHTEAGANDES